jgi:hypothetical protein
MPRALADQQLAILFDHGCDDPFHNLEVVTALDCGRRIA